MICKKCRDRDHIMCPELFRQDSAELNDTEKAGSVLCDCQHYVPGQVATEPGI